MAQKYKNNKYGGWSNFFVRNENQLFKVDKKLKKSEAIFIEPLACSLNAVIEADIKDQRKKVLIIGTGIIGIGVYIFLREQKRDQEVNLDTPLRRWFYI